MRQAVENTDDTLLLIWNSSGTIIVAHRPNGVRKLAPGNVELTEGNPSLHWTLTLPRITLRRLYFSLPTSFPALR